MRFSPCATSAWSRCSRPGSGGERVAMRDEAQDRRRVLLRCDRRSPASRSGEITTAGMRVPGPIEIALRRRDVIELAPELVVRHDHQHVLPPRALPQPVHDVQHLAVAFAQARIARMLVLEAHRLVEAMTGGSVPFAMSSSRSLRSFRC